MAENQTLTILLSLFGGFVLLAFSVLLLHSYANWRKTPWYALITTWFNWYLALSIVVLIPVDVQSSLHARCMDPTITCKNAEPRPLNETAAEENCVEPWIHFSQTGLSMIWNAIYWTTYIMCWAIIPVMQSYVLAGHFHFHERLIRALKENLLLYAVMGIAGGILGGWFLIKNELGKDEAIGIAMAIANVYGLVLVILLLGYGLTEIPRKLWRKGDKAVNQRFYQYKVFTLLEEYEKAKSELEATMRHIKKWDEKIKAGDPFRTYVDIIISKCPIQYKDTFYGEGDVDPHYSKLVALHNRLLSANHEYNRTRVMYDQLVKRALTLEDIVRAEKSSTKTIEWTYKKKKSMKQLQTLEWYWKVYMEHWFFRALAIILACCSLVIVWSEAIFGLKSPNMSIISLLITSPKDVPYLVEWGLIFFPIAYIAYCAYWSLFQLKIFNYYRMLPHGQSDANSILFNAYYLARIIAPMAHNFLLMVNVNDGVKNSAFLCVMGKVNLVPLGKNFFLFFPILLSLSCAANVFNLYTRFIMACSGAFPCCFKTTRFDYDEDFSDARMDKGKLILQKEREFKEQGRGLSIDIGVSLIKNPSAKSKTKRGFFSFFRKKQDGETEIELLEADDKV